MQVSEGAVIQTKNKEKIVAIDFIRAVCAIGIILYHISCYSAPDAPKVLYQYANGGFGVVFVAVFFMVSGSVLYHNYPQIPSLRQFYYKRWKTLFPMFYITWGYFYLKNVLVSGGLFYHGKPLTMLLTVFGLDGYFRYRGLNYYLVGEWFFGAIILLYVLYPLFLKLVNKLGWKVLIGMIPLWVWQIETDVFTISAACNLIHCSSLFLIGMLIFKYRVFQMKPVFWACAAISVFLLFVPIPGRALYKNIVLGITLFFVLFGIGNLLMKLPVLRGGIGFISALTFPMFLLQNQVGSYVVARFAPTSVIDLIKVIAVTLVLCILSGWCVRAITNAIMNTKWYRYFERLAISGKNKKTEV